MAHDGENLVYVWGLDVSEEARAEKLIEASLSKSIDSR
jgi:hypothetical protein